MSNAEFRRISSEERYLRILITEKYGRVSQKQLADLISHITKRDVPRQLVDQVITGKIRTAWVRKALAHLLGKPAGDIWEDMKDPRTYQKSDIL